MKTTPLFTALLLGFLLMAATLHGVGMQDGPTINPQGAKAPTTEDDITCSWTPSADTTSQNASWYNGSTRHNSTILPDNDAHTITLNSLIARKGETWSCNISLSNGTNTHNASANFTIKNADPQPPNAINDDLYEDNNYNRNISTTDSDNDTLEYFRIKGPSFCTVTQATGDLNCLVTHDDLDPLTQKNYNATFLVIDEDLGTEAINVTYTAYEVNDEPTFTLSDQTATESILFNYSFDVSDEEEHFPVNFTIASNLSTLALYRLDNNSAYITFNRTGNYPLFTEKGTWWVRVNVTDNGPASATPYDDPNATQNFTLTVNTTNQAPNITTNFSGITGTQGNELVFYANATDLDNDDSLSFGITSNCSLANPWSITTTNSSPDNATGKVNETLTNDHIVCRWVNITVSDSEDTDWEVAWLNLTNTNDAPTMHELSDHPSNSNSNTNMSNLTAVKGMTFWYQVNATDPDQWTYEGETLNYSDNSTNDITIDNTTGVVSFMPNDTHTGFHYLTINATDDEGLWDSRPLVLEVINNTAPALVPINDFSCDEDAPCTKLINATDPDPGEDLVFASNNTDVFDITDFNETAWRLNFVPSNSQVGTYAVTVNVTDKYGFSDSDALNFTINNVNDAPYFDNVSFGTVVVGYSVNERVDVIDEDLDIGMDNLSYDWEFLIDPGNLNDSFTFSEEGTDYFIASFTPNAGQTGSYVVNLSATDNSSETHWQNVSFDVVTPSNDPVVDDIMPYWDNTTNTTIFGTFGNVSWFTNDTVSVNTSENTTVMFDAMVRNDTSFGNNSLTFYWYINGALNETLANVEPGSNSSFSYPFEFFSAGNVTFKLSAMDVRYARANWTWQMDVADVNRLPAFYHQMPNITVNKSTEYVDFMSHFSNASGWQQLFYDPDDDLDSDGERGLGTGETTSLTYSIAPSYSCSLADITFSGDNLAIDPDEVGTCIVKFRAADPYNESVDSNLVWITITSVEVEEINNPVSSGGGSSRPRLVPYPYEDPVESPYPLELISPEDVFTYRNETVEVPLVVKNTWNDTIADVYLNATTGNGSGDMRFRFSTDYFPSLAPQENVSVTMYVENYREGEPASIIVSATVVNPDYVDSTVVMINSLEKQDVGEDVESKVTFARDLLNDNPECQELNELLVRAEEERVRQNYDEAIKLVDTAVNGCKYLINEQLAPEAEQPKSFFSVMTISPKQLPALIIGGLIVLIMLVLGVLLIISGKKTGKVDI
ncbi:hypothetical protein GF367_04455 [Candidatus Woesearchaeota archaeon]|nr:hypothetical protein [Candidatus Woesearchaeota archaeon]